MSLKRKMHWITRKKNSQTTKKLNKKHPPISRIVRHNDHHFIIMDKQAGMPTQPDKTGDMSLLQLAEIYCKRRVHAATRLDRPASGLNLFGKTPSDVVYIRELAEKGNIEKEYIVVVEGKIEKKADHLEHFLFHNKKTRKAEVSENDKEGHKNAKLSFQLLSNTDNYSILKVQISSGRFHQIRAQLAHIGFPIKGDVKYGARRANKDRSIHLLCYSMKFKVKSSGKDIQCIAEINTEDNLWALTKEILDGGESK